MKQLPKITTEAFITTEEDKTALLNLTESSLNLSDSQLKEKIKLKLQSSKPMIYNESKGKIKISG